MIKEGTTEIKIYTDGAAKGNPGKAGWAAVIILDESKVVEIGGHVAHATNNQMELSGPIEALKYVKAHFGGAERLEIVSDSKYVILGITEWITNWQKNNWRNAANKPVVNKELWEELHTLTSELKPTWTYVKGHNEDLYNERADVIATSMAAGDPIELKK